YDHALAEVDSRVDQIADHQWSDPTPCANWDVRALVAHVVDEQRWVPFLLSGGSVANAGDRFSGDPLGDDPKGAWRRESRSAREAFHAEGALDHTVALSYGDTSARDYLWEMTRDLAVHAWDLARGIGADEHLDPELVRRIHHETQKDVESLAASGLFDPPAPIRSNADLQTRMLALFGRRA
ncbi:MAG: TIGR03086 family metal-binding protein, partial [Actinomycetes bacterium]